MSAFGNRVSAFRSSKVHLCQMFLQTVLFLRVGLRLLQKEGGGHRWPPHSRDFYLTHLIAFVAVLRNVIRP